MGFLCNNFAVFKLNIFVLGYMLRSGHTGSDNAPFQAAVIALGKHIRKLGGKLRRIAHIEHEIFVMRHVFESNDIVYTALVVHINLPRAVAFGFISRIDCIQAEVTRIFRRKSNLFILGEAFGAV